MDTLALLKMFGTYGSGPLFLALMPVVIWRIQCIEKRMSTKLDNGICHAVSELQKDVAVLITRVELYNQANKAD